MRATRVGPSGSKVVFLEDELICIDGVRGRAVTALLDVEDLLHVLNHVGNLVRGDVEGRVATLRRRVDEVCGRIDELLESLSRGVFDTRLDAIVDTDTKADELSRLNALYEEYVTAFLLLRAFRDRLSETLELLPKVIEAYGNTRLWV